MARREEMSTSFGAVAGIYEAGRPGYPREAVSWMLRPVRHDGRALRAADVGAGTGKLTRTAVELGAEVVAIDPDPGMLKELRARVHGVPTFAGTAERMPLRDASLDALLVGQAWHWVDPEAGSAEAARVLRSGGVLGLVWNTRDESVPWVARLTETMRGSHAAAMLAGDGPTIAAPFSGAESAEWRWSHPMTRAALLSLARSRSYVITATADERDRIETDLAALLDEIGAVGDAVVELPYVTRAYRAIRP